MARGTKNTIPTVDEPGDPDSIHHDGAPYRKPVAYALVVVAIIGLVVAAVVQMRRVVDRDTLAATAGKAPKIVLVNQPAWVPVSLTNKINELVAISGSHSVYDRQLLKDVHDGLISQPEIAPWFEKVHGVRRVYRESAGDVIEVDCKFRVPVAVVQSGNGSGFWYVDSKGVVLPECFAEGDLTHVVFGQDGQTIFRIIEGVANAAPDPGMPWKGEDLRAGLELALVLSNQPCAKDVVIINVEGYAGKLGTRQPPIVLKTRYDTTVAWGHPVSGSTANFEVGAETKLARLNKLFAEYGRIDAKRQWVDIRMDKVLYRKDMEPQTTQTAEGSGTNIPARAGTILRASQTSAR